MTSTWTRPTRGAESPLADVQALLPAGSGVTQNDTPDPRRCNFTWDDGGPRGIDVAIVPGGRSAFDVPAGYEPVDGYGDEAYTSSGPDGQAPSPSSATTSTPPTSPLRAAATT